MIAIGQGSVDKSQSVLKLEKFVVYICLIAKTDNNYYRIDYEIIMYTLDQYMLEGWISCCFLDWFCDCCHEFTCPFQGELMWLVYFPELADVFDKNSATSFV